MLKFVAKIQTRFANREDGATAVEYGLMVAMIAIVIVAGVTFFGLAVSDLFLIPAGVFKG